MYKPLARKGPPSIYEPHVVWIAILLHDQSFCISANVLHIVDEAAV